MIRPISVSNGARLNKMNICMIHEAGFLAKLEV